MMKKLVITAAMAVMLTAMASAVSAAEEVTAEEIEVTAPEVTAPVVTGPVTGTQPIVTTNGITWWWL